MCGEIGNKYDRNMTLAIYSKGEGSYIFNRIISRGQGVATSLPEGEYTFVSNFVGRPGAPRYSSIKVVHKQHICTTDIMQGQFNQIFMYPSNKMVANCTKI